MDECIKSIVPFPSTHILLYPAGVPVPQDVMSPEWFENASIMFIDTLLTSLGLVDQTRFTEFEVYWSSFKIQNVKVIILCCAWQRWRKLKPTEFPLRRNHGKYPQKPRESLFINKCLNLPECSRSFWTHTSFHDLWPSSRQRSRSKHQSVRIVPPLLVCINY
jgi:hypothetical protein